MKPLSTEDCYVNVEGWSEDEVQRAAKIFSETFSCTIGDVSTDSAYHYLFLLDYPEVFVGDCSDAEYYKRTKEITKDQVFNPEKYIGGTLETTQEIRVLFHMDIIDRAAEAVHKLHTMTSSVEDTRKRMMFVVRDALGRLQKNLEDYPEYDRSVRTATGHWVVSLDWSDEFQVDLNITVNPTSMSKSPFIQTPLEDLCDSFVCLGDD